MIFKLLFLNFSRVAVMWTGQLAAEGICSGTAAAEGTPCGALSPTWLADACALSL